MDRMRSAATSCAMTFGIADEGRVCAGGCWLRRRAGRDVGDWMPKLPVRFSPPRASRSDDAHTRTAQTTATIAHVVRSAQTEDGRSPSLGTATYPVYRSLSGCAEHDDSPIRPKNSNAK